MKIVEVVIVERIANPVGVLEVLNELILTEMIAMGPFEPLEPARIYLKGRWQFSAQFGNISPITIHVIVSNHHSHAILAHITPMTFISLWVTPIAELIPRC